MKIPFAKISCEGKEFQYVKEVIESGWLTTADRTHELEERFSAAVGAKHACAVSSCTAALHLALDAFGVGVGDQVFVPDMTFVATAEVVRYLHADPIFLDVDFGTGLVTPDILRAAIAKHPQVKVLMVVHYAGQSAPMISEDGNDILTICREAGIRVVEDAAHAFPAKNRGKMVGSLGDATCFSFYANKPITTGEGGMIVTDNEDLFRRAKIMRLHGINHDIWERYTAIKPAWEYDVVAPGFKYNLADINAAIGLAQLEKAEEYRKRRQTCAEYYYEHLKDVSEIGLPEVWEDHESHAWHLFPVVLEGHPRVDRANFIRLLSERGVSTSVHYKPIHRMSYYRDQYNLKAEDYPNCERIFKGRVSLPIYPALGEKELAYICSTIKDVLA